MCLFILQNSIICVLFVLAFLAGGITNAIYASENDDHERVVAAEGASAVS